MGLVSLSEAKQFINNPDEDDALVTALIVRASADIETYLMRTIEKITVTETLDGGHNSLVLVHRPIIQIISVQDFADPDNPTTIDPSDFVVYKTGGFVTRGERGQSVSKKAGLKQAERGLASVTIWAKGLQRWEVQYEAGFDPVPEDIKQATLFLVLSWYNQHGGQFQSERIGDYSYSVSQVAMQQGIPSVVKRLLAPYRETVF